jgi:hypothetical protein
MFTLRKQLRRFVWLAVTAMLALSLLPTVAHALSFAKGDPGNLAEICTAQGSQWVSLDGVPVDSDVPTTGIGHLEDCPYCSQASAAAGLPPLLPAMQLPARSGAHAPPLFLHAPRTLFAWASAQPRAPPALT